MMRRWAVRQWHVLLRRWVWTTEHQQGVSTAPIGQCALQRARNLLVDYRTQQLRATERRAGMQRTLTTKASSTFSKQAARVVQRHRVRGPRQRHRVCADGSAGSSCNAVCPTTVPGRSCSGHGTCGMSSPAGCVCDANPSNGFWANTTCNECAPGYYGARCTAECPGGACSPCSGRGVCHDGVHGSGTCACLSATTTGHWSGSSCNTCAAGIFGDECTKACPVGTTPSGARSTCGAGRCSGGPTGDGSCACDTGFQRDAVNGSCTLCSGGFYGRNCLPCPTALENVPCSGHGVCSDGVNGTGACSCGAGYAGVNCSLTCPFDSENPAPSGTACKLNAFAEPSRRALAYTTVKHP